MRHLSRIAVLGALFVTASSCQALFPFTPDHMTETRIRAFCHFIYACCTPIEAATYVGFSTQFKDEGTCVSELLEDDTASFLYTIDQTAKDAIDRGVAEYDAEAAESCTSEWRDAVNACDIDKLTTPSGGVDINKVLYLVDGADQECAALAGRGFARGTVGDGDDCQSSVDCEDFGICVVDEDTDVVTIEGECRALAGEGDSCEADDFTGCQPGLACEFDGENTTCEEPERLANGDACDFDDECESDFCDFDQTTGTCFDSGDPCTVDEDCDIDLGDFCDIGFGGACASLPEVKVEICDGE